MILVNTHTHTDGYDKKVEQDIYATVLYFWDFYDHYGYEY